MTSPARHAIRNVPARVDFVNIVPLGEQEVVVAVTGGRLSRGPWERIFSGEYDGRRPKGS